MAAHAKLSASKVEQAQLCPGSLQAQAGYPNTESKAARDGTAAHWMAEQVLIARLAPGGDRTALATDYVGRKAENGVKCTMEMARDVEWYIDHVLSHAEGAEIALIEAKLDSLTKLDPYLGGTSDGITYRADTATLYVDDYKNGTKLVDPEELPQALTYGLGALLLPQFAGLPIRSVEISIVQPNAKGGPVKTWATDVVRLGEWAIELKDIADAARKPGAPRVAGKQCTFCLAKADCQTHYEFALDTAGLTPVDFYSGTIPKLTTPSELSPEEFAKRLKQAEHLERWIKGIKEIALTRALEGNPPAGKKAIAGRGTRKFIDEAAAHAFLAKELDLPIETFFKPGERLSVAQTETQVGKKALKKLITEVDGEKVDPWKALIVMTPGAPQLVDASDERPAIDKTSGFDCVAGFDIDFE